LDCQVCKFCCQVLHGFSPFILTHVNKKIHKQLQSA
jgi:hypothetical protein